MRETLDCVLRTEDFDFLSKIRSRDTEDFNKLQGEADRPPRREADAVLLRHENDRGECPLAGLSAPR